MIKVKVNLVRQGRTLELEMPEGSRVRDLIKRLGYPTTGVVVTRDSRPLLEDEVLTERGAQPVPVASGG